jgi:PAS domain S-box-containing protein
VNAIATLDMQGITPPIPSLRSSQHSVQFYVEDRALIDDLCRSLGASLVAGGSVILIATPDHREQFLASINARGLDTDRIIRQGRLLLLDAADTLTRLLADGAIDAGRFNNLIGGLLHQLTAAQLEDRPVAAYGEMVALLWADGRHQAALQLEKLWNQLATTHPFQLRCAYSMELFGPNADGESLRQLCAEHTHVFPAKYSTFTDSDAAYNIILRQQNSLTHTRQLEVNKQAEDALYRLAAIVESSDDAIISKDLNGIISSWNKAAQRILGYTVDEIIGRPITLLIPPELQAEEVHILKRLRAGERIDHFQTVRLTKGGERIDVSLTVSPVRDRYGKIIGAAKILRDITQQKKLEAALHVTERLASVGRLAATVAHEINNPLEAVVNAVYLAKNQPDISDETRSFLNAADSELARVAHIAQQTLGFYRENSQPIALNLPQLIQEVLDIYACKLKSKSLRLQTRFQPDTFIVAMQGELKQVLSNILANAIDASTPNGRILVRCQSSTDHASGIRGVRIVVADTGTGISAANQAKLFAPFFTTKKAVGTGLGLWISRDLLVKRGGNIRLRSSTTPGRSGTVMEIFLPA